eukprot:gb/GEZN01014547.1/.p1 GENE.gb/GEZN01014547.1/~~gb/GEZN01014547.1/.p1  ORF type:complete len:312 (-),score=14.25 gb/GEZN01014547.1/:11-919(-)
MAPGFLSRLWNKLVHMWHPGWLRRHDDAYICLHDYRTKIPGELRTSLETFFGLPRVVEALSHDWCAECGAFTSNFDSLSGLRACVYCFSQRFSPQRRGGFKVGQFARISVKAAREDLGLDDTDLSKLHQLRGWVLAHQAEAIADAKSRQRSVSKERPASAPGRTTKSEVVYPGGYTSSMSEGHIRLTGRSAISVEPRRRICQPHHWISNRYLYRATCVPLQSSREEDGLHRDIHFRTLPSPKVMSESGFSALPRQNRSAFLRRDLHPFDLMFELGAVCLLALAAVQLLVSYCMPVLQLSNLV